MDVYCMDFVGFLLIVILSGNRWTSVTRRGKSHWLFTVQNRALGLRSYNALLGAPQFGTLHRFAHC